MYICEQILVLILRAIWPVESLEGFVVRLGKDRDFGCCFNEN